MAKNDPFKAGRRASRDGQYREPPANYYSQPYKDAWLEGFDEAEKDLEADRKVLADAQTDREMWLAIHVEPVAESFDATPEVIEDFIDLVLHTILNGKVA